MRARAALYAVVPHGATVRMIGPNRGGSLPGRSGDDDTNRPER